MKPKGRNAQSLGKRVMERLDALALISEVPGQLTRRYLTPAHIAAMQQVEAWMREAGMQVHVDPIANVIGRIEGAAAGAPAIVIGSHIDTVVDAGRYDGNLGVIAGIEAAQAIAQQGKLRHAVEVVAFGDEEGVRFPSHLLSSRALTGAVRLPELDVKDEAGTSVKAALTAMGFSPQAVKQYARKPGDIAAYIELHIEQGPVLEAKGLPLAAVTAINGATRMGVTVKGTAGHAGTVPMGLRQDALAAAAEMLLAVEMIGKAGNDKLVATVGRMEVRPGAPNVVPGDVIFSLDFRSPSDALRKKAQEKIVAALQRIAKARNVDLKAEAYYDMPATAMDRRVVAAITAAIETVGHQPLQLASGAGHDAMAIAAKWPAAMMFVRCKGGISHNPAESITLADADVAVRALIQAVRNLDAAL